MSFFSLAALPLWPGFAAFIIGTSFMSLTKESIPPPFRLKAGRILFFIAGFGFMFVIMGLPASSLGHAAWSRQDLIRLLGGGAIILMGIHLAGPVILRGFHKINRPTAPRTSFYLAWSLVTGLGLASVWNPSPGPVLTLIIITAGTAEFSGTGLGLLSVYALGLGLSLFLVGLTIDGWVRVSLSIPVWGLWWGFVSGSVLVLTGILMIFNLLK